MPGSERDLLVFHVVERSDDGPDTGPDAGPGTVRLVLEGRLEPRADRREPPVLRVPFDVPSGTTRIDVRYRVDDAQVVDLGLADPSFGPFPARSGFRGWSGGARDTVFVASDDATPGYLPGPIPPGRWSLLLGRADVHSRGCAVRVWIELQSPSRPPVPPVRRSAAPDGPPAVPCLGGPGWYAGDLQTHTHHSDARGTLDDLVAAARDRGLDFVAVTDHNTVSHHRAILQRSDRLGPDARPLLLPGLEVTSYHGHANVWYPHPHLHAADLAAGWVDFRLSDDAAVRTAVQQAHAQGGLVSLNHPKEQPGCIGCDWTFAVPSGIHAFEAWQGPWPSGNHESLCRYDDALRAGLTPTLVGGSDRHQPARVDGAPDSGPPWLRVGSPTTWVYAEEGSGQGLLTAIAAGRVCVSESPEGPLVELVGEAGHDEVRMGDRIRAPAALALNASVHGAGGDQLRWTGPNGPLRTVAIDSDPFQDRLDWQAPHGFVRAEVIASDGDARMQQARSAAGDDARLQRFLDAAAGRPWIRALSNPVHLTVDPLAASGRGSV